MATKKWITRLHFKDLKNRLIKIKGKINLLISYFNLIFDVILELIAVLLQYLILFVIFLILMFIALSPFILIILALLIK